MTLIAIRAFYKLREIVILNYYIHIYAYMHTHIHTHTYTYIHTHTHIYISFSFSLSIRTNGTSMVCRRIVGRCSIFYTGGIAGAHRFSL